MSVAAGSSASLGSNIDEWWSMIEASSDGDLLQFLFAHKDELEPVQLPPKASTPSTDSASSAPTTTVASTDGPSSGFPSIEAAVAAASAKAHHDSASGTAITTVASTEGPSGGFPTIAAAVAAASSKTPPPPVKFHAKKVKWTLTGHEMPLILAELKGYREGRKYRQAMFKKEANKIDLSPYKYIVPHKRHVTKVYCLLTKDTLNRVKAEIDAHVQGRRYLFLESLQGSSKKKKQERPQGDMDEDDDVFGFAADDDSEQKGGEDGSMELLSDAELSSSSASNKRKRLASSRVGRKADISAKLRSQSDSSSRQSASESSDVNTRSETSDLSSADEDMVDDIEAFRNSGGVADPSQEQEKRLVSPAFSHVGKKLSKRRKHQMDTSE